MCSDVFTDITCLSSSIVNKGYCQGWGLEKHGGGANATAAIYARLLTVLFAGMMPGQNTTSLLRKQNITL